MTYSANDNQNYFLKPGRTTSRVLNRPGGTCSLSMGTWTEAELARMRQNQTQSHDQQESEETNNDDNNKGDEVPSETVSDSTMPKENTVNATTDEDVDTNDTNKTDTTVTSNDATNTVVDTTTESYTAGGSIFPAPRTGGGVSSNAFASSSTTNSYNVLTDRPTSRVLRPPGGHTSIRLG